MTAEDGNFLGAQFFFSTIPNLDLVIGSFPESHDLHKLRGLGVKQVVNLQTRDQMAKLKIKEEEIKSAC